jgi:hypothetical protein
MKKKILPSKPEPWMELGSQLPLAILDPKKKVELDFAFWFSGKLFMEDKKWHDWKFFAEDRSAIRAWKKIRQGYREVSRKQMPGSNLPAFLPNSLKMVMQAREK